jgi:hypothetical protein
MIKTIRKKKITFFQRHGDDLLILAGSGLIIADTALLNLIAALYVAGVLFIAAGVLVGLGTEDK